MICDQKLCNSRESRPSPSLLSHQEVKENGVGWRSYVKDSIVSPVLEKIVEILGVLQMKSLSFVMIGYGYQLLRSVFIVFFITDIRSCSGCFSISI